MSELAYVEREIKTTTRELESIWSSELCLRLLASSAMAYVEGEQMMCEYFGHEYSGMGSLASLCWAIAGQAED